MIKKIFLLSIIVTLIGCVSKPHPGRIIENVVLVNDSSGIVVYSNTERALVLTAHHVIEDDLPKVSCTDGCNFSKVKVRYLNYKVIELPGNIKIPVPRFKNHDVIGIDFNEDNDLAILEISTDKRLLYAKIAKNDPELGEDLWLAANPNYRYRSIKRGEVSAKEDRFSGPVKVWEVNGGAIFGSSGGGAFNMDGELFGIIRSIDIYESPYCYQVLKKLPAPSEPLKILGKRCVSTPISFMGYIVTPFEIRKFLLNSRYSKYFKYLE